MRDAPRLPVWLGRAAILPQFGMLCVVYLGPPEWHGPARILGLILAALGLSFVGGAWWGFAAGAPAAERRNALGWLWVAAALMLLVALSCLAIGALQVAAIEAALVMLGAGALVSLGVDARLGVLAPRWWMPWRVPLAILSGTATILLALA